MDNPWDLISRSADGDVAPEQRSAPVPQIYVGRYPDSVGDGTSVAPQQSAMDKLLGNNGPRYQLWPERFVRGVVSGAVSGATLPRDAIEYDLERAREFQRTGRITMSDTDVSPLNTARVLDLATFAMPINPAARAGDLAVPGARMLPVKPGKMPEKAAGMTPVPSAQALREASATERMRAAENPAASGDHFRKAAGNEAAAEHSQRIAKAFHEASTAANPGKPIRDRANALMNDDEFLRHLSKEEITQLELVARGTRPGNLSGRIASWLGQDGSPGLMGGWVGAGTLYGTSLGGAEGAAIGFLAPPIAAKTLKTIENASSRRQLRILDQIGRKDSPLYEGWQRSALHQRGNPVTDLYRQGLLGASVQGLAGVASRGDAPGNGDDR